MTIRHDISLKSHNTFGLDVKARSFAEINSKKDLHMLFQSGSLLPAPDSGEGLLVLGGGSNILFTSDFPGLVLKINILGMDVIREEPSHVFIQAGAGVTWDDLVAYAVERNYGGLENLSGIPGCVGASPIQNIGAYGSEMKDCFESLEAFDLENSELRCFSAAECRFAYRDSIFKRELKGRFIILSVTFRLSKSPALNLSYQALCDRLSGMDPHDLDVKKVREAVLDIRASKLPDPALIGNAGSFFKNPMLSRERIQALAQEHPGLVYYPSPDGSAKVAAGWLIEQCGWKGFREGDAGIHRHQALVLVNHGQATGKQLVSLAFKVRDSVMDKFGIQLEPEVQII